jgi:tRNA-2-methylthio-N6-dimethylallyladenosine synthase
MKYYIETFGCQLNKSDGERIERKMKEMEYKKTLEIKKADLVIINMCSIRQSAVDRVIGRKEKIKGKKSILTGCIMQNDLKVFKKIFSHIFSIKSLNSWDKFFKKGIRFHYPNPLKKEEGISYFKKEPLRENNFSALIPISSGCNNFCTYCVVPFVRGKEISRSKKEIIDEAKKAVQEGAKEIWLLGQNVNSYNFRGFDFADILKSVNEIKGDFWIRFTSPHPKDFSKKLIKTMKESEKVTEYLNLPLQSGNDRILKKMNRPYTTKRYINLVKEIKKNIPDIFLSTDIIVGFPEETKKEFQDTLNLVKEIEFGMIYISKFSKRKGTLSEKMIPIQEKEKKKREKILTDLLKKISLKNNKKIPGKTLRVLVEKNKKDFYLGKTRRYRTVKFKSNKNLIGKFVTVKITKALSWGLEGKIINTQPQRTV